MIVPVYTDMEGRSLVHAKNADGTAIYGMGRAFCPLLAASRACRAELAWRARMARREDAHQARMNLPLWSRAGGAR